MPVLLSIFTTSKALVIVWNEKTTIDGTLHNSENTSTCCCTSNTNIKDNLEWAAGFFIIFFNSELNFSKVKLGKEPAGSKETSAVSSSIVGKTELDAIVNEFGGVGLADGFIVINVSNNNLSNNLGVGDTSNKAVLSSTKLCLVLLN